MTPACAGSDPALFDSTYWSDHARARAICATCPAVAWCLERALRARADSHACAPGPHGTWAGQLWRDGRIVTRRPAAKCGTERGYQAHRPRGEKPCDECKAAHAEHVRIRALERRREVA